MSIPQPTALTPAQVTRLASAFEISPDEVLVDVPLILGWLGSPAELRDQLNALHGWQTDEAFYFVRWVGREAWDSRTREPD
jgi:hypothetical protein